MIVITGAAGFIGSVLVSQLTEAGFNDLVLVDHFNNPEKNKNLEGKKFIDHIDRDVFFPWLDAHKEDVEFIVHIGARSDTTEHDMKVFDKLNINYTKDMWNKCVEYNIPLVYASSAATYGMGEHGYVDSHDIVDKLKPLNPYGESKNEVDKWALKQEKCPPFWAALKFFNVYGPNEYHKGRMASVVLHAFKQIGKTNAMKLFRSHNPDFKDGEQLRDFVYVKDLCSVIIFLMKNQKHSGIYNLGTGSARSFLDLTKATFAAMGVQEDISFIDTPEDIRDKYQYFTEADMRKLRSIGYDRRFYTLEEGVEDYVKNYLIPNKYE
ncbi:MAG: ADP-glyceromanno-heptose 6-epimerase [Hyphomicrobiales bacterium]